ncbi:MAG: exodeoxyribonuclease V subunit alpha [Saprospiraceae bacterium]
MRMNESLKKYSDSIQDDKLKSLIANIQSTTIHRLLKIHKYNIDSNKKGIFKINYDIIIVDESSMIDITLMSKLFNAIDDNSKLILLGDKNQLSSIGAGSIFGDLCSITESNIMESRFENIYNIIYGFNPEYKNNSTSDINIFSGKIIELTESYRFNPQDGIGKLSKLILNGDIDKIRKEYLKSDSYFGKNITIINEYDESKIEDLLELYDDYALEEDIYKSFEKLNKIKFLCSVVEGKYSVSYFNKLIESRLLENKSIKRHDLFYDKQPIIITENDYNLGLFNGDIGIIKYDNSKNNYYAYFLNDDIKIIPCIELKKYSTAYALSIHKSQGSEFENVIIVLNEVENENFLTRELLYTAITRAKEKSVVISKNETLLKAISNKITRISGIKNRIFESVK